MDRTGELVWRDHRSARRRAAAAIGGWPGNTRAAKAVALANGTVLGSFSARHAEKAWTQAAGEAAKGCAGIDAGLESLAQVGMVAALASHLGACSRCWQTGPYDSSTPVAWIMWACARRPGIAELVEPVLRELAGQRLDRTLGSLRMR